MKIFYGWRIVAAAAGIQFLHAGLLLQAFGAYVAVLSEERGWSKTALSGGAALQSIEGALLGPALGWLIDRFGPRAMVQAGIIVFGLGFIALSQIDTIGGFYAAILVIAVGASFSGYFPAVRDTGPLVPATARPFACRSWAWAWPRAAWPCRWWAG